MREVSSAGTGTSGTVVQPAEVGGRATADVRRMSTAGYLEELFASLGWRLAPAILLMLLISLTEGVGLLLLLPMLEAVGLELGSGTTQVTSQRVTELFGALGIPLDLATVLGIFVVVLTARALLSRFEAVSSFRLQQSLVAKLRARLYESLSRANWLFFVRGRNADTLHTLTRELEIVGATTFGLLSHLVSALIAATYIVFALLVSPFLTAVVLLSGGAISFALRTSTGDARTRGADVSQAYQALYATISDHLAGMKTAKGHGVESGYVELFSRMTTDVERAHVRVLQNHANVRFWFRTGSTVIMATIVYISLGPMNLPPANVILVVYLFARLIPMLSNLQNGYQTFISNIPALENVKRLERRCIEEAEPRSTATGRLTLERAFEFRDVSFGYEQGRQAVTDVNLTLEAGSVTAIVGPSGSGKSTLADLAVGLLRPDSGVIELDGVPLDEAGRDTWRQSIGYVTQDTFIFHATVRANLLVANPGANEADIHEAIEAANASFVHELPRGLDTILGDRGVRLSGGEQQRIALARALLRQPTLLVLDEATSALDGRNERQVLAAVQELRGRVTLLVISHRLSTVRGADRIHLMEHGRIVESGHWETMQKQEGRLKRLLEEHTALTSVPMVTSAAPEQQLEAG